MIDLGCGAQRDPAASEGLDFYPYPGVTVVHDLTDLPWPVPSGAYDAAVSHQVLEHLPYRYDASGRELLFRVFDEVWRILRPGGLFRFDVPHNRSPDAYLDPTHYRYFGPLAFEFLWNPARDSFYHRRPWGLVSFEVDRRLGLPRFNRWHDRKYLTRHRWIGLVDRL